VWFAAPLFVRSHRGERGAGRFGDSNIGSCGGAPRVQASAWEAEADGDQEGFGECNSSALGGVEEDEARIMIGAAGGGGQSKVEWRTLLRLASCTLLLFGSACAAAFASSSCPCVLLLLGCVKSSAVRLRGLRAGLRRSVNGRSMHS